MSQANLLLLNIGATLCRMGATIFIGLWTTRIVYQALGKEGFGVYATIWAFAMLLTLGVDAIGAAVQRHVAFAIGQEDQSKVRSLVGTAVTLNMAFALLISTVSFFGAPLLLSLIEAGKDHQPFLVQAIRWAGGLAAFMTLQAPYKSYLTARQSIFVINLYEFIESVSRLLAALYLAGMAIPTIAAYAKVTCVAIAVPTLVFAALCTWIFPATRPGKPDATREISQFGFWLFIGVLGWKIRTQGAQIVINKLCGPAATAAYNVSLQLAMYQNNLTMAINRAVRPAIVTSRGNNNTSRYRALTLGSSKILCLTTLFFALPMLFETRTILNMWLGEAPELMVIMVRLALIWMSFKDLTAGHTMAIHAGGRVAKHEIVIAVIDAVALAVAGSLIYFRGDQAWVVPVAVTIGVITQCLFKVIVFGKEASSELGDWLRQVVARYAVTFFLGYLVVMGIHSFIPASFERLMLVLVAVTLTNCGCIWWIGFDQAERRYVRTLVAGIIASLRNS